MLTVVGIHVRALPANFASALAPALGRQEIRRGWNRARGESILTTMAAEPSLEQILRRPRVWALLVGAMALGAIALQAWAIGAQSYTHDEPYHLLAGYQALRYGTNTLNLEHPPLVKLVAALPLLTAKEPVATPTRVENASSATAALFTVPEFVGAWRLGTKSIVAVVFGGLLLWGCFLLGREVAGPAAGFALTLLLSLSFALFPHFGIVQTDVAATAGFVLTLVAASRFARHPSLATALATGSAFGFAMACKFSGVLLAPTVLTALVLATRARRPARRLLAAMLVLAAAAQAVPLLCYGLANLHYDRAAGEATLRAYCEGQSTMFVENRLRPWEEVLLTMGRWAPGPAQWLTGLLAIRAQNELAIYSAVSFGEMRSRGRWWYHPALFLIKTPLVILLAMFAAALSRAVRGEVRWRTASRPDGREAGWLIGVTVMVYLAFAVTSNYNLGSRHLMPVVPLLYLPAAVWLSQSRRRMLAAAAVLLLESFAMGPYWIQATNTWWLGRWNPSRFASITADYEWKQNFIALAAAARRRGIDHLHLVMNDTDPREIAAYLPGSDRRLPGEAVVPGWYAVSLALEQSLAGFSRASPSDLHDYQRMMQAAGRWRELITAVEKGEDHGIVGGTFRLVFLTHAGAPPSGPR